MGSIMELRATKEPKNGEGDDDLIYYTAITIETVSNGWVLSWVNSEEEEGIEVYRTADAPQMLEALTECYLIGR